MLGTKQNIFLLSVRIEKWPHLKCVLIWSGEVSDSASVLNVEALVIGAPERRRQEAASLKAEYCLVREVPSSSLDCR